MMERIGASNRWVLIVVVVALVAGGYLFMNRDPAFALMDADCPDTARYPIVLSVYGSLRQDDIAVIDKDGDTRRLTKGHTSSNPTFSPDGTRVAYEAGDASTWGECCGYSEQGISVIDIESGEVEALTSGPRIDSDPAWSPDGTQIAFTRDRVGLMVIPVSGGTERVLYRDRIEVRSPRWSSDGTTIAFVHGEDEALISTIDADGGSPAEVAIELGSLKSFTWSPDGQTFAYAGGDGIYTLTVDKPNPRKIFDGRSFSGTDFSANGGYVLFFDEPDMPDEEMRLAAIPVDGGEPIHVVDVRRPGFNAELDWLDCS